MTFIHVEAHLTWSVVVFSTLLVVVVVRPVIHRLNMPPTATVKAISSTVAIIGLMALELINFINQTHHCNPYAFQHVCPDLHSPVTPIVRHFPAQVIDVLVSTTQVPATTPPGAKLDADTFVTFFPVPE
jgi:hypothetical protein